jgi:dolichyl-phosphate beta-glucosyltransferase
MVLSIDSSSSNDPAHASIAAASSAASTLMLSIIVPAYNEEKRLGASLKRMLTYLDEQNYAYEILVVDDGSTDKTAAIVEQIADCRPQVQLLTYQPNRGKGHAVRYGMLRAQGERILFCDADLATPIEEVEKLLVKLDEGYEIAIGSRDVAGSQLIKRQSFVREMGGRTFNKMVQALAVPGIHDTQCGFKIFTRSASHAIFSRCKVDHFAFDVEMLYIAIRLFGLRVAEVPVRWAHQEGSKVVFWRDAWRMAMTLGRIRVTRYDPPSTTAELNLR